jgi:hypothetical protein
MNKNIFKSFISKHFTLPIHRLSISLELKKVKKIYLLSRYVSYGIQYRIRGLLDFRVPLHDDDDDEIVFFIWAKLLEINFNDEDEIKYERIKESINNHIDQVRNDEKTLQFIDLYAQLKNRNYKQVDYPLVLENRTLPKEKFVIDFDLLSKEEKRIRSLIKKDVEKVKDNSTFKLDFSFSDLSSIFAVITPIIFIGSYLHTKIYFHLFDIEIAEYFTIGDYLSISIDNVQRGLLSAIFGVFGSFLSVVAVSRNLVLYSSDKEKRKNKIMYYLLGINFIGLTVFTWYQNNPLFFILLSVVILIPILEISSSISFKYFKNSIMAMFFLSFTLQFFSNIIISSFEKKNELENNWKTSGVEITLKKELLENYPSKKILIGKNSNYLFLTDTIFRKKWIVLVSELKSVTKTKVDNK